MNHTLACRSDFYRNKFVKNLLIKIIIKMKMYAIRTCRRFGLWKIKVQKNVL